VAGKTIVTCSQLESDYIAAPFARQKTLPSRFPQAPGDTTYCGAVERTRSYYYLFNTEDRILMDFYQLALEGQQCSLTGIQEAPRDRSYTYLLPYTCTFGRGVIATYGDINAYVVTLE
jgi:hypothetical protein